MIWRILKTRWQWRLALLGFAMVSAVFGLLAPLSQKMFVDILLHHPEMSFPFGSEWHPLMWVALTILSLLISTATGQLAILIGARESNLMQRELSAELYQKIMNRRWDQISDRPLGEVVSIYAVDIPSTAMVLEQVLPWGTGSFCPLIVVPFALSWFYKLDQTPLLIAVGVISILILGLAARQAGFFTKFKQLAAERIGLVQEWIQNIRVLRILSWTEVFEKRIFVKRQRETLNRLRMVTNGQMMNSFSSSSTYVLSALYLVWLAEFRKLNLSPGEILSLVWVVGVFLLRPFRQMPWFFVFCFDAWTSSKRLQSYFKQYESYVRAVSDQDVTVDAQLNIERSNKDVTIRGLSLGYGKKEILKNINLEIERGEFVAIAGEVGAGKSSLLLAMIGEVGAKFEKCEVRGRWAFVPQESFIMNAQLHENVQMQYAEDYALAESVEESLRLASFASTQEGFEQGLQTQIGERGVNLSGGQKQRIALARAHRVDAEILFLDDVFSALDANTERAVLNDLVLGVWRKKTRVLITHRLSVLPLANRVIFMADGQIQDAGKFSDLLERNESFRQFVASIQTEEKTEASGTQEQI